MANEQLLFIEEIAEIRAALTVNVFVMLAVLENLGSDGNALLERADVLHTEFANKFEADMRRTAGFDPRKEPREPILRRLKDLEFMRPGDRSHMNQD